MPSALLISVRFHDGRYHGTGPWPPAPARLFQALVAGAARGGAIPDDAAAALGWLEGLDAPVIAAPPARPGQPYRNYVPNNDLDARGGDPARVAEIRAPKQIRPRLFDADIPLLYCWTFENDPDEHAKAILAIAEGLYQLGRGVDMAFATAEILGAEEAEKRLEDHGGAIHRPSKGGDGDLLACPGPRSLDSLIDRHRKMGERFTRAGKGRKTQYLFNNPPRPRFRQVAYDSPPVRRLYDLRNFTTDADFHPRPLKHVAPLTESLRDRAATRLSKALPDKADVIERVFGRVKDMSEADKAERIRITPLPSIGHAHAESSIRRVLVEIPPNCPLATKSIDWAFSGLTLGVDDETGEIDSESACHLVPADHRRMMSHYGIRRTGARRWQTITPAALPEKAARRRIDPDHVREQAKDGKERFREERRAGVSVVRALRHAGICTPVESIRVQREPLHRQGARAEDFAHGDRFTKHRLSHVEITFAAPRTGPVVIGDGRYLGLGLLAPLRERQPDETVAVYALDPATAPPAGARADVLTALRRALMALDRDLDEDGKVSTLFSGHGTDGGPAGERHHEHVFLAADTDAGGARLARLYVIRPDAGDRKVARETVDVRRFDRVTRALDVLRAGPHGVLYPLRLPAPPEGDRLFGRAKVWTSLTDYRPTRHPKKGADVEAFLKRNVRAEALRRGLPEPQVEVLDTRPGPRGGLRARLRLTFAVAMKGPILLGKGAHKRGEGVFGVNR